MRRSAPVTLLVAFGTALACGGGGSGSGSQPAQITSENAEQIAADVLEAIALSTDLGTLSLAGFAGDVWPDAAALSGESPASIGLVAGLRAASALEPAPSLPGAGVAPAAPVGPITENCEISGTVTSSGNIADPGEPTVGDRLDFRFVDCVHGVGLPPLNGDMGYAITRLTGSLDTVFTLTLAHTFDDFTSGTGDDSEQIDGNASTEFDNTSPPLIVTSARGSSLRFGAGAGNSATSLILSGFDTVLTQDIDTTPEPDLDIYDIEGDGRVESSEFTGSVDYAITEQLAGVQDQLPDEGVVLVTGDSSAMRIVVVDTVDVDLELDLDGDGEFPPGDTIHTTWAVLAF